MKILHKMNFQKNIIFDNQTKNFEEIKKTAESEQDMKMMQMKKILFSRGRIENQRGLLDKRNLVGRNHSLGQSSLMSHQYLVMI